MLAIGPLAILLGAAAPHGQAAAPGLAEGALRVPRLAAEAAEAQAARLLSRLSDAEPTVEEVQRAAAAEVRVETGTLEGWAGRARRSAWLPRLLAEVRHEDRTLRITGFTGTSESDVLRVSPGTEIRLQATWDLDALVFSANEIRVAEAASHLLRRREEALERATRLYFQRRRLRLALLVAPPDAGAERAERELALDEVTAELDALTGGLFRQGRAR